MAADIQSPTGIKAILPKLKFSAPPSFDFGFPKRLSLRENRTFELITQGIGSESGILKRYGTGRLKRVVSDGGETLMLELRGTSRRDPFNFSGLVTVGPYGIAPQDWGPEQYINTFTDDLAAVCNG